MARNIGSQYTTERVLGRGSAGTVWLGRGPDGPVAIKVLREDLAADAELVERFAHERRTLLGLEHPRIVGVRELVIDEDGTDLALVMDLVRGTDLRAHLNRHRRLAPADAVALTVDVADALAVAHRAGVVHRDVKPENILLDATGPAPRALLADFGVAQLIDEPRRGTTSRVVGTPDYIAPEIVEGLPSRAPVDIYSLATVLYELLAGFTPFGGGHTGAVLRRHVTETAAPLPGLPDELWELLQQCLAKAPASRLRAAELASRLRGLQPALRGLPALDIESEEETAARGDRTAEENVEEPEAPRGAVALVRGSVSDPDRVTHTRMRVPDAEELAGGANGTARLPRTPGQRRAGSARHGAAERRRRLAMTLGAVLLAVALVVGGVLALA
ncbi:serine/threonine-protein kinase [Streptomyces spiramenti]|uniref:non-specific serine/threonine protein kinase n=1 Tax=Streptomyces spiramenti TaxID=2720606 RepID=A0ABX1AJE8_9ACTN|nr:serine/threonine-protein kinase [Streptomyces spiramenti]NJP67254.1 serine/threonine protein kinase [Streptomyces spiramenti]